jgi:alanine racemase
VLALPLESLRLKLDADALASNWRALDRLSGQAQTGAAVKANGYGLGAIKAAEILSKAGCRDFFVAHWQEALELKGHIDPSYLSVLNGILPQDIAIARQLGAKPVINSISQAMRWTEAGGGYCDLMIDSGMNRLGVAPEDLGHTALSALDIDICMSHLASADEDSPQNAAQQKLFDAARQNISARRYSLANSAGISLGPDYHYDLTRPGLSLYGGVPRDELANIIKPVASIEAAILQIRHVKRGAHIGYNASFTAQHEMRLAIVALGYADGYLRSFSNKGAFVHKGMKLPVIGRVSMDLTIVDISAASKFDGEELAEGDWLALDYDLANNAALSGLSQYELLTGLGSRFERVWAG